MKVIFSLLMGLCVAAMIVGWIKPELVIRWGAKEQRNRENVLKYYGIGFFVSYILFALVTNNTATLDNQAVASQTKGEVVEASKQLTSEELAEQEVAKQEEAKEKEEAKRLEEEEKKKEKEEEEKRIAELENMDPTKCNWETKETNFQENGNLQIASSMIVKHTQKSLEGLAEEADGAEVLKAIWKYYGKVLKVTGEVNLVTAYPPESELSNIIANGAECYEIHLNTDNDVPIGAFIIGDSSKISTGDYITFYGLPVGMFENQNAFGGVVKEIIFMSRID